MKKWNKLGKLYDPSDIANPHPKLVSHAANPLPVHIDGSIYRIYFSGRDESNRSSVGAVDIDILKREIVKRHHDPFFQHGEKGSFYSDGVSIGNCYIANGVKYMLFMGWQAPSDSHWRGDIGRLIVTNELMLQLDSTTPFIASDEADPISLSYPWVIERSDLGFDMWYGSTVSWDAGNGEMLHVINAATSRDGNSWTKMGNAVPYTVGLAQAFSRPTVIINKQGNYDMWFSYRSGAGETYRIGYASSKNGKDWSLDLENSGIDVSEEGWDSEMIEYPFVFEHQENVYMLYNGNSYGRTGFGLAVLED